MGATGRSPPPDMRPCRVALRLPGLELQIPVGLIRRSRHQASCRMALCLPGLELQFL